MKDALDAALVAKYPLIFRDRNGNMKDTAMCWGLCVGDGWYNIIDVLCSHLTHEYNQAKGRYDYLMEAGVGGILYGTKTVTQEALDEAKAKLDEETLKVPVAVQVKEKFGGLRFYVQAATDRHYNYISFAESMSYRTCEQCGAPGKRYTDGWHQTLCEIHAAMGGREINEGEEFELDEDAQ
jgi:hypothetical protein